MLFFQVTNSCCNQLLRHWRPFTRLDFQNYPHFAEATKCSTLTAGEQAGSSTKKKNIARVIFVILANKYGTSTYLSFSQVMVTSLVLICSYCGYLTINLCLVKGFNAIVIVCSKTFGTSKTSISKVLSHNLEPKFQVRLG